MKRSIVFWNVERLFAAAPSAVRTTLADGEPDEWSRADITAKVDNIRSVLRAIAVAHGQPLLVGLCEVETTGLAKRIGQALPFDLTSVDDAVEDSSSFALDGINIGLLYDPDFFDGQVEMTSHILDRTFDTRDILECRLRSSSLPGPLTVYVNHWASRLASEGAEKRINAAHFLSALIKNQVRLDTGELLDGRGRVRVPSQLVLNERADQLTIAMGDFNDEPFDRSVEILNTTSEADAVTNDLNVRGLSRVDRFKSYRNSPVRMFNPFWTFAGGQSGTYYRSPRWRSYDQIMISRGFLNQSSPAQYRPGSHAAFSDPTLTVRGRDVEMTNRGGKPKKYSKRDRTGCSDHFPVVIEVDIVGAAPP